MLVLSRKLHEKVLFPDFQATVEVVAIKSGVVRLGIDAPRDVPIFRKELLPPDGAPAAAPKSHALA